MTKHIGIVAVSPEGAASCYRQLFRHASVKLPADQHPVVSIYNIPLALYIQAVRSDNWRLVGQMLRESAQKLAEIGAEFCFTPDNAVQHAVQLADVSSPIPWIKMTDAVADRIARDERTKVGVIGTKYVTSGSVYQTDLGIKGIKLVRPSDEDAEILDKIIFEELIYGSICDNSRRQVMEIVERLAELGCEGLILGCSEAPLMISTTTSPLPLYDASDIIAERAMEFAAGS
ncbi:MAG: amino acid racemase [Phycisphaerales bacterium]|nr:amino acid racemase [Phycisphaerales bacterium]